AALVERYGEERANLLWKKYRHAFPAGYREEFGAGEALLDIEQIEALEPERGFAMNLRPAGAEEAGMLRFKIYRLYRHGAGCIPLSDTGALFKRLGGRVLFEHPHKVEPAGAVPVWIVDFGLIPPARALPLEQVRENFHAAFFGMWSRAIEGDHLNRLVLSAGLSPREITIL